MYKLSQTAKKPFRAKAFEMICLLNSVQLLCGENEIGYWHIAGMRV